MTQAASTYQQVSRAMRSAPLAELRRLLEEDTDGEIAIALENAWPASELCPLRACIAAAVAQVRSEVESQVTMSRAEYRRARRMVRDNGNYALRWLKGGTKAAMEHLVFNVQARVDWMAERADIVSYCRANGLDCNVRHTGARGQA